MLGRVVAAVDRVQRRRAPLGVVVALQRKLDDDNGGSLVASLAYSGFVAVFPLLLVLVTVLGIVAGNDPGVAHAVERSVLAQFPIIGSDLQHNVRALHRASVPGLVVGLVGLAWGATGLGRAGVFTMEQVWDVPEAHRLGPVARAARSVAFLLVLGLGVGATGFLSGFGLLGRHGVPVGVAVALASPAATIACYLAGLRLITARSVPWRRLVPGAVAGGLAWSALEATGDLLVGRVLRHESAVYGMFAIVLGLLAWIYLGSRVAVYAAELNAVLAHRLWPRSLVAPRTGADALALALVAERDGTRDGARRPPGPSDNDAAPHVADEAAHRP